MPRPVHVTMLFLLATGCSEPAGFLSPDTVRDITIAQGDEVGTQRSGMYAIEVTERDCGCDLDLGLDGLSVCSWVDVLGTLTGDDGTAAAIVEATDGQVVFRLIGAPNATLVGPMQDGGGVSVGAVTTLETFVASGALITRIDGDFDREDGNDLFNGEIAHRVLGEAALDADRDDVDCEEYLEFRGTPVSLPGR